MTKVLITGGAGFIGSHIAQTLQGQAEVRILDNFRTGSRANLVNPEATLIEGSILDAAVVRKAVEGVDWVFHLAALVSVPESVLNPDDCTALNVTGFMNVLEASARSGVSKVCFSSSAAIYGDNPIVPKTEDMTPEPRSPYASTKLEGERLCRSYTATRSLPTVSLRYFNVFGPRQNPAASYAAAIPIFIKKALANEPITIYGDGGQTRDFVYVRDVAEANVFAATNAVTGEFNVGYGVSTTVEAIARKIIALCGSTSELRFEDARLGDVRHSCASVEKLRGAGFSPSGSLDRGLGATIQSMR